MLTISEHLTPKESEMLFRGFFLSITASFLGVILSQLIFRPYKFVTPEEESGEEI